jgi:hypothetical protein
VVGRQTSGGSGRHTQTGRQKVGAGGAANDPSGAVPVQPPPIAAWKIGASRRSLMVRSIARAARGANGMVTASSSLGGAVAALDSQLAE